MTKRTCGFEGCNRAFSSRNLCKAHARQLREGRELSPIGSLRGVSSKARFSDPSDVIRTLPSLVSIEIDGCWIWRDRVNHYGYGVFSYRNKTGFAHRTTYEHFKGEIPEGHEVDHICWNRLCCNPDHLRAVTRKQNCENFSAPATVRSKTGVRGVYLNAQGKYDWSVCSSGIEHAGRGLNTLEEAAEAVRLARLSLHTHNTRDRVPA